MITEKIRNVLDCIHMHRYVNGNGACCDKDKPILRACNGWCKDYETEFNKKRRGQWQ